MRIDRDRAFRWWLLGITVAGIGLRLGLAFWYDGHTAVSGDGLLYLSLARFIGRGVGFLEPVQYLGLHRQVPTAVHPPLYPLFLSVVDIVGMHGSLAHRLWSCVPSAVTIPVIGSVARELAGRRAGLLAAAYAAASASLAIQDVLLWSEGLYVMMTVVTVWCAYRLLREPRVRNAIFLAAAITLSALTRAEAIMLLGFLLLPILYRVGGGRDRVRLAVVALVTVVVLLIPWTAYNATRFERPVITSTGLGPLLWSSNCTTTYHGPNLGGWGFICLRARERYSIDESVADGQLRDVGLRYASHHVDRLPAVISARLARTFGLWHPAGLVRHDLFLDEAGLGWVGALVAVQFAVSVVISAYGLFKVRQRRKAILPLLAPVATVALMTVVGYGSFRFRAAADAVIPIMAGVGLIAIWDRWRNRTGVGSGNLLV